MADSPRLDDRTWLEIRVPLHERLSVAASSLIENIIRKNEIEYLGVSARTKTVEGALEKIQRKEYEFPQEQLTDLSGIRVVTYLEEQATQISLLIKELFEVDEINSHDRSADLGPDRIGYRSTHFVCTLGTTRGTLPEYEGLGNLKFEIQIRTVLQHAWAELAHDRSFKFGAALPNKIQRKLNLYSGLLEIVDGAFDEIAKEIDQYKSSIKHQSIRQISRAGLDSISIARFVEELAKDLGIEIRDNTDLDIVEELKAYGLKTIGDIEALVSTEFRDAFDKRMSGITSYGVLRYLMMYNDLDAYFKLGRNFHVIGSESVKFLETKYKPEQIDRWLKRLEIDIKPKQRVRPASSTRKTRPKANKRR